MVPYDQQPISCSLENIDPIFKTSRNLKRSVGIGRRPSSPLFWDFQYRSFSKKFMSVLRINWGALGSQEKDTTSYGSQGHVQKSQKHENEELESSSNESEKSLVHNEAEYSHGAFGLFCSLYLQSKWPPQTHRPSNRIVPWISQFFQRKSNCFTSPRLLNNPKCAKQHAGLESPRHERGVPQKM